VAETWDAIVVGSGPNGLAAAITLARAGCSVLVLEANSTIGGGARSAELTLPAFVHDVCSAVHPLAAGSPFFQSLPLERFGLRWIQPEIPLAHPFDDGTAACLYRELDLTADSLGEDKRNYYRLMQPLVCDWQKLSGEFLQPMLHLPRYPIALAKFGMRALCPTTLLTNLFFKSDQARALFAGIAAHSFLPLESLVSSAFAFVLGSAGHAVGWPIPHRGSQSISDALAAYFHEFGGKIELNRKVDHHEQLPKSRTVLFDTSAWNFLRIAAKQLPHPYRRWLRKFRHAPGIFKIDYALSAAIPWRRMNADAPERFMSAEPLKKSPLPNEMQLLAECRNVRSCWLRSKVYLMTRAHRTGNIRFGLTPMCRSVPILTSRKKSRLKSNGSRLAFAIALLPGTK
jgi:phytoene dehydrogenase-like protein